MAEFSLLVEWCFMFILYTRRLMRRIWDFDGYARQTIKRWQMKRRRTRRSQSHGHRNNKKKEKQYEFN